MEIDKLWQAYNTGEPSAQEQAAKALAAHAAAPAFLLDRLGDSPRQALALLARCCRRKPALEEASGSWRQVAGLLQSDDAKTRKNAAVLLGTLGVRESAAVLAQALQTEQQQFVRPSMILALGAIGGKEATDCLKALPKPVGEDKHSIQEADALDKALSRLAPGRARAFTGLPCKAKLLLVPVTGLYDSLQHEAAQHGIALTQKGRFALVETDDYPAIFNLRCFHQAMLPVAGNVPFHPEAFAKAYNGVFKQLAAMHDGDVNTPFAARIELRRPPKGLDRGEFASAIFRATRAFTNAPSGYDIELRAVGRENGSADLFCLIHSYHDDRFAYRLGSVPASINPAAAVAALRLATKRQRPNARVLDPFCGSGTMLVERGRLSDCATLHGVDISREACAIARSNSAAAGMETLIYNRDAIGFKPEQPYDEIICNMPFGNRVGNHSSNEKLYSNFFRQLSGLFSKDGYALCITTEKSLVRIGVKQNPLSIKLETSFSYGGLNPSAFIITRLPGNHQQP